MEPHVSVVIPSFGQASFLSQAVDSVLQQSFADWELVLAVGDEDSAGVARGYRSPRIHLLEGLDQGVAHARNQAIQICAAPLILTLDADDLLARTFLERTVPVVKDGERYAIVATDVQEFGDGSGRWELPPYSKESLHVSNGIGTASLFTKALWQAAGGYDVALLGYEDWAFWIACSKLDPSVTLIHEPLFHYRLHAGNGMNWARRHDALLKAMIRLRHPDIYPAREGDIVELASISRDARLRFHARSAAFPDAPGMKVIRAIIDEGEQWPRALQRS